MNGTTLLIIEASCLEDTIGSLALSATSSPAILDANRSSPYSRKIRISSASEAVAISCAAVIPESVSIRISSGASKL